MRRALFALILVLIAATASAGDAFNGVVKSVRTAEVMTVDTGHGIFIVRLFAVDAPKEGAAAERAKQFVANLVLGKVIHARLDGGRRNGEMVSTVGVENTDVGLELVRVGLARRRAGQDYKYGELSRAEEEARRAKRGVWAQ